MCGPGHQDPHPHAAASRRQQRLVDERVGHEVRRGDVDGPLGGGNGHQVHQMHAVAARRRRADEEVRVLTAGRRQRRELRRAVQHLAGRLDPVVVERRLELRHDRSFDPEVGLAPVVGILAVALPVVGDADPAGEGDLPVDDEQLAVRAVVQPPEVIPAQRPIALHAHAGVLHQVEQRRVHLDAAGPVDDDRHRHAGAGAFGQGLGHLPSDLARPVDVGLEADGRAGGAHRRQHGGEDLDAVLQVDHPVAGDDGRAHHHAHLAAELRVAGAVAMRDVAFELLLGHREVHAQDDDDGRRGRAQENDRDGAESVHASSPLQHSGRGSVTRRPGRSRQRAVVVK